MKSKKGFTLIEIIIVVIIIGVLAAVALPRLTSQVNISKAAEAYMNLGVLMRKIQECYITATEDYSACDTTGELSGYLLPVTGNFTYAYNGGNATSLTATATLMGGNATVDTIMFTLNPETGSILKTKRGIFSSLKN
ncbi:MAG: prepilin-type N-terminal cleavage/methylation domain-containing protein [Candidatus Omnitrophota bacterium]